MMESASLKILRTCLVFIIFSIIFCLFNGKQIGIMVNMKMSQLTILCYITIFTAAIFIHIMNIKIVLYRIMLQSVLNQQSIIYKFLSFGSIVRIIAFIFALSLSFTVITFIITIKMHMIDFCIICFFCMLYAFKYSYKVNDSCNTESSVIRGDLYGIFIKYKDIFVYSLVISIVIMLVKLILVSFPTVFGHQELIGFGDIIHKAADAITENEITWRPARVIVRHICAFELAVESLLNIPEYGKVIYIVSTLISHNIPLSGSILLFFLSIFQIIDFAMAQMTFQFPCGGR